MAFDYEKCNGCPLDGLYEPLESRGSDNARFLVVTDVPSMAAGKENRLLTAKQMGILTGKLGEQGFSRDDFRFTPACHCPYDPNEHVNKVKSAAHKHCRAHLLAEVNAHPFEAIVPLGAVAASQAFGKSTKITKVRGMVNKTDDIDAVIFPLMSPGIVLAYPQNEPLFTADVESFGRSVNAGYDVKLAASQQIGHYEIVEDLQFLIDQDA